MGPYLQTQWTNQTHDQIRQDNSCCFHSNLHWIRPFEIHLAENPNILRHISFSITYFAANSFTAGEKIWFADYEHM